jgi:hypothetical protein
LSARCPIAALAPLRTLFHGAGAPDRLPSVGVVRSMFIYLFIFLNKRHSTHSPLAR